MSWELDESWDMDETFFCECGVTLMGDSDEGDGLCGVCAGAPHHRECPCDECGAYWADVADKSAKAAEAFKRQLVCSCGWTGPYIEYHRDRQPSCSVAFREDER